MEKVLKFLFRWSPIFAMTIGYNWLGWRGLVMVWIVFLAVYFYELSGED